VLQDFGERLVQQLPGSDELVDDFFGACRAEDPRVRALLDRWVSQAPNSAVARSCRAMFWLEQARVSRGSATIDHTSPEQLAQLRDALKSAQADARAAAPLESRLPTPHLVLVEAAMLSGDDGLRDAETKAAAAACPACLTVRVHGLYALARRWGGTAQARQALVDAAPVSLNPRFAALAGFEDLDRSNESANPQSALAHVEAALSQGEHWAFLDRKARLLLDLGRVADAEAALVAAEHLRPGVERLAATRVLVSLAKDDVDDAAKALGEVLTSSPTAIEAEVFVTEMINRAVKAEQARDSARAVALLDLAAGFRPDDRDLESRRNTSLLHHLEATDEVTEQLRRDVGEHPEDVFRLRQLDLQLSRQGNFMALLPFWNRYLQRHPGDARALCERAGTRYQLGDLEGGKTDAVRSCELGLAEGCHRAWRLGARW
jgi:hypothetical protein